MVAQVNASDPVLDVVGGSAACSTAVMQSSGVPVDMAFNSRTGVFVQLTGSQDGGGFEVVHLHLVERDQLGAELFCWDGPSVDAPMAARPSSSEDPQSRCELRREELTALVAALDHCQDVLAVITAAEGGRAAREAIVDLLGVSPFGAEVVTAMVLTGFRADVARGARAELAALQDSSVDEEA